MAIVGSTERVNDFGLVGKLGLAFTFGEKILGQSYYGDEDDIRGIFQRRHSKGKVIYVKERFYIPKNPQTTPQQTWRDKFKDGMTAWANLTDEQKNVYNLQGKRFKKHGVNIFMTEYLNS